MVMTVRDMKPAATYLRCSTETQERSIEDQRGEAERHATENGFQIIREFADNAISGTSVNGRKAFVDMIETAQQRDCPFRYILAYDIKRFSRGDVDEAGYYRHVLKQHGIEVIYMAETFAGNDSDDIVRSVKQYLARQESKDLSKVTIRGQLSNLRSGYWNGGTPPYGHDLQYFDGHGDPQFTVRFLETGEKQLLDNHGEVTRTLGRGEKVPKAETDKAKLVLSCSERVALVNRIFDMYVRQSRGYKAIAEILNIDGIPSPRNGTWSRNTGQGWSLSTIRSIIMNPLYQGDMVWNRRAGGKFHRVANGRAEERKNVRTDRLVWNDEVDWEVIPNSHAAIIRRHVFEEAQRLREQRSVKRVGDPFRSGRARDSVYLLGGLIVCSHCSHHFHGYTINSTKRRKDGTKIKTRYYACGGAVAKGKAHCERRPVPKDALEAGILDRIKANVEGFLTAGGREKLRDLIAREIKADAGDPQQQRRVTKKRLDEINTSLDRLLDSLTPVNKDLVDKKIIKLTRERAQLEGDLEDLEAVDRNKLDADALADEIAGTISGFEELFEKGTLEEKKEFIRLFVESIELNAEERRAVLRIRKFPAPVGTGKSSFEMVAGAGFEPATFGL
jgi:DNA invertase Pin-like site-specific DNA recombinase